MKNSTTLPNGRDYSDPIVFALAYEAAQGVTPDTYLSRYEHVGPTTKQNIAAGVEGLSPQSATADDEVAVELAYADAATEYDSNVAAGVEGLS